MTLVWDVLEVRRSGFYAWRNRPASVRSLREAEVVSEIKQIQSEDHKDVYASPRMHLELVARGVEICETTVANLMQREAVTSSNQRLLDRWRYCPGCRLHDRHYRLNIIHGASESAFQFWRHVPGVRRDTAALLWYIALPLSATEHASCQEFL